MDLGGVARFGTADYAVFVVFIIVSLGIGVYYAISGGRQQTTKEYLTADKELKVIPTALSLLVSFQSAIMILGFPAEMYMRGAQLFVANIGLLIGAVLTSRLWVPLFYKLQITSTFEYLYLRFDSVAVRKLGSAIGIFSTVTYMGTATFAPSTALEAVTGFPVWASILVTAGVGTIYTSIGGMKAVIWTDVFQSIVMLGGILTVVVMGIIRIGSISRMFEICHEHHRLDFFNFDFDPRVINTFWSINISTIILWCKVYGTNQASVQRFCSLPTLRKANAAVLLAIPMQFLLKTLVCFAGLVIFAYYTHIGCDPLEKGYIKSGNQILPFFVMDTFRHLPGFPGLFLATLFSGALSSISSGLNALSAITWEDFLKDKLKHFKESSKTLCTKLLVVIYGLLSTGIACLAMLFKGPILQANASIGGAILGSSSGLFILAAFTTACNWKGALAGPIAAFPIILWIAIGGQSIKGHGQYLSPGPIDRCYILNESLSFNSSAEDLQNVTFLFDTNDILSTPATLNLSLVNQSTSVESNDQPLSGIQHLYSISYFWYTPLGIIIAVVIGLLVSYATGGERGRYVDESYTIHFWDSLCCCVPKKFRCLAKNDSELKEGKGAYGEDRSVFRDTKFQQINTANDESRF